MADVQDIRKALENGTALIGTERTMASLKRGDVQTVFITKNCPDEIKEEIEHLSENVTVEHLDQTNVELGVICKKSFNISVLGILRSKAK